MQRLDLLIGNYYISNDIHTHLQIKQLPTDHMDQIPASHAGPRKTDTQVSVRTSTEERATEFPLREKCVCGLHGRRSTRNRPLAACSWSAGHRPQQLSQRITLTHMWRTWHLSFYGIQVFDFLVRDLRPLTLWEWMWGNLTLIVFFIFTFFY